MRSFCYKYVNRSRIYRPINHGQSHETIISAHESDGWRDITIAYLLKGQQLVAPNVRSNQGRATMEEEDGDDLDNLMTKALLTCMEKMIEEQGI